MGRHSDGKPNYRVAKAPLILLLVAVFVGALIVAWFALRAADRDEDPSLPDPPVTTAAPAPPPNCTMGRHCAPSSR